jgi:hypothetical protein
MALPDSWLDHLFGKLAVRYGDAWDRKWSGVPMHLVRADWAQVLDGMSGDAIAYGLRYLPEDFPPTATAFKALCDRRPTGNPLALPAPVQVNHAAVARIREKVGEIAAAKARQSRPRTTFLTPDRPRAPQGPLPWPRGVPRPESEASA